MSDPITPNMGLTTPVVLSTLGPTYATEINADLNIIDDHDHSPGSGVPITPAGLNIIADLPFNINNITGLRSTRYSSQSAEFAAGADINCCYVYNGNLVYRDNAGNNIQITAGGGINISSVGTIGGDYGQPGVPAAVTYSNTTKVFSFTRTSGVGAQIACSNILLSDPTFGAQSIDIIAPSGVSAYTITLPAAASGTNGAIVTANTDGTTAYSTTLPGNYTFSGGNTFSGANVLSGSLAGGTLSAPTITNPTVSGTTTISGVINSTATANGIGFVPVGAIIATFPNLTGAYSCVATTIADSHGFVLCNGQTISDGSSPMNGQVIPNLNASNFLMGSSTAGTTGGSNTTTLTNTQLPAHTHTQQGTFTSGNSNSSLSHTHAAGTYASTLGISDGITISGGTASLTGTTTFAANGHTHTGAPHIHQWGYSSGAQSYVYALNGASGTENQSSFNSADGNRITFQTYNYVNQNSGTSFGMNYTEGTQSAWTAGPANNGQTGSNSSAATVGISSTGASRSGSVTLTGSNAVGGSSSATDLTAHTHSTTISGATASTGGGAAYDSRPAYITTVWIMRIK